ncbi:MAG: nucleotide exchange factor GrpE [Phycisphaerales bacterium]|jgi:molecular chaperone GrpE|nr:nucleotide exchange factor GrpE [Phycisphaerales bacterium]
MNTDEVPVDPAREVEDTPAEAPSIEVDDALIGQITDEAEGDLRAVLEWYADELELARTDRLRALAELSNNQRRASENEVRVSRAAVAGSLRSLLTVSDQLDLALEQDAASMSAEQFAEGVRLARDEFMKVLADQGAHRIEPEVGDEFDPQRHEAMLQQAAEGIEPGHITMVMQPGFETGHHVLRAAKVAVAP